MAEHNSSRSLLSHIRRRITTGLLLLAPAGITFYVITFLFRLMGKILKPIVTRYLSDAPPFVQTLLSVVLLLLLVYLTGVAATNLFGRWLIRMGETVLGRVPIVRSIYNGAKQIVTTFSGSGRESFESVVWVRFIGCQAHSLGFVTGSVTDSGGKTLVKVFMPTAPNPTSGFLMLMPPEEVIESNMSVDVALQMIVSGGILGPDQVKLVVK